MSKFLMRVQDIQSAPFVFDDIGHTAVGLRFSTALGAGVEQIAFRVYEPAPPAPAPAYLNKFHQVDLLDEQGVFASGRLEDLFSSGNPGGEYWDVAAHGFGFNLDDSLLTSTNVQNTPTSTVITDGVTATNTGRNTKQISVQSVTASGFTLSNTAAINLKMMTIAEVLKWAKDFDADNEIIYVYPQDDGDIEITVKARPTTPDLYCYSFEFERLDWGFVSRILANEVVLQYNDGASTVTVDDTTLQAAGPAGWGFVKTARVFAPNLTNSTDATQLANTILAKLKTVRMAAKSMTARSNVTFYNSEWQEVPLHRVRAGMLLQFVNIPSAEGDGTTLDYSRSCMIARTDYDEDAQLLQITPENYELTMEQELARVYSMLRGRFTTGGAF